MIRYAKVLYGGGIYTFRWELFLKTLWVKYLSILFLGPTNTVGALGGVRFTQIHQRGQAIYTYGSNLFGRNLYIALLSGLIMLNNYEKLYNAVKEHAPSLEAEDFKQISKHGIDAGFNGFIYYSDTIKFFDRNEELITDFLNQEADDLGVDGMFKLFNKDYQCYSIDEFKNWASWYIAETVAHEIANNSRLQT
mgnify:CR=1 FL=1